MLVKFLITCMISFTMHVHAQKVPDRYKTLIEEAYSLSKIAGDYLIKGFHETPFTILLITDSAEFLILHPRPSSDFISTGDSLFSKPIYVRPVKLSKQLLATFPAVNGISCIVTGTPENTGKSFRGWVISLLHEHFHQYQQANPDYHPAAEALNLSNGDQTGMWMLNYPFPYDSLIVIKAYSDYSNALHQAVTKQGKRFNKFYQRFLTKRNILRKVLRESDYNYFSFQLWQEGIARYIEYAILKTILAQDTIRLVRKFRTEYRQLFDSIYQNELNNLKRLALPAVKRIHFYSTGFAEGLLLDKVKPRWLQLYAQRLFTIDHLHSFPVRP